MHITEASTAHVVYWSPEDIVGLEIIAVGAITLTAGLILHVTYSCLVRIGAPRLLTEKPSDPLDQAIATQADIETSDGGDTDRLANERAPRCATHAAIEAMDDAEW